MNYIEYIENVWLYLFLLIMSGATGFALGLFIGFFVL